MKNLYKVKDLEQALTDYRVDVLKASEMHEKLCEMHCNGEGYVFGRKWRLDCDDAYIDDENNIFDKAIDIIEKYIIESFDVEKYAVQFQHDPRGATVLIVGPQEKVYTVDKFQRLAITKYLQ